MIHIKHRVDKSNIHGLGLFTLEDLKKGQLVYTASPKLDLNITQEIFDSLDQKEKDEIKYWGFKNEHDGLWHVDFDMSKFINHSFEPTLTQDFNHKDVHIVTTRDVKAGEELTQNYLEFEKEEDLKRRGISLR